MKRGDFVQAKWGKDWIGGRVRDSRMVPFQKTGDGRTFATESERGGSVEVLIRFQGRGRDSDRWIEVTDSSRLRPQSILRNLMAKERVRGSGFPKPGDFVAVYSADAINVSCLRAREQVIPAVVLGSFPEKDACKVRAYTLRMDRALDRLEEKESEETIGDGVHVGLFWNAHLKVITEEEFLSHQKRIVALRRQIVAAATLVSALKRYEQDESKEAQDIATAAAAALHVADIADEKERRSSKENGYPKRGGEKDKGMEKEAKGIEE